MRQYLLILVILFSSAIYSQDLDLNVEKDEMVLEVKGMVCSMCAFGIQEGLSELSFLNNKKFKADGIEVDLDTQMIYIPIDLSKTIDELEAIKIVKDAGYDTVSIYTNFDGKSIKKKAAPKLVG
ncbi:MAG: heavy-metal-associated domain-containing protein [Candidatus Marinimicrobia bacterium]|jgi:copper chaperone CopZ|nr:heavy-metal-associated domain-containing protein [Candidatus Neomarinimicrobiota bacterium]MBT4706500.1 heavy-metal-associated domain-containing protein [Candidatus Neomarinimicrobiota bacterium]MBT4925690.1 heavy-metal-associated domain-containing protein [Candidatus Neomarinimicrobiota bacterium]MBT5251578.1 heavy-metal-associated domain-containing protein [Candidatus Neomarinimicrobiota bacterium]MBT5489960.1 heavy-metal-associated domain-containing protein [Candidatus Neomarinimicrobiota|tara:strand:- start:225 stop:596 length:372 start_codon:yes stop_codon:yes gene_type:complete